MYKKILVATDGSAHSIAAMEHAAEIAKMAGAEEIHVITIAQSLIQGSVVSSWNPAGIEEDLLKAGKVVLHNTIAPVQTDAKIVEKVMVGEPADSIADYAETNGMDLIVMGCRGNGQLKGLFLGSVSSRVLVLAKCPVLVVK